MRRIAICGWLIACMFVASAALALSPFFIFFDSGSTRLTAQAHSILDNAAQGLRALEARRVVIEGWADRRGSSAYNLDLSRRRAETVRAALIERGVPAATMTVEAWGENRPLVRTANGVSEPRNRVVAIVIYEMCGPAPGMPRAPGC